MSQAQRQAADFNSSMFSRALSSDIKRNVGSVVSAVAAPGEALRGNLGYSTTDPRLMDAAANMAGVVSLGSAPMPRPRGSLGMGGNYVRDLSADTPLLYREMNSERANNIIDNNLNVGAVGQDRLYWSDAPELAKGQGDNTGVRMTMRSEGVQGKIDTTSKPGLAFVQQTKGGREFVTQDGVGFDKVDEVHISPEVLFRQNPDDRRMLNRLRSEVAAGKFETFSPDGFITVYRRVGK